MRLYFLLPMLLLWSGPAAADFLGLLSAARLGNLAVVEDLLEAGADPNPPSYHDGYSPLQFAAGDGAVEMTESLLAAGADPDYRDHNGDRAILWAAQRGHADTVALLLAAGSPADAADDPYGQTPLMEAAAYGHEAVVRLLLEAGADPNRFDHSGDTALHNAARYDHADVIAMVLGAGANPNVVSRILIETPLHEAVERGGAATAQLLIDAGAAVDALTKEGETPMLKAARGGRVETVAALLAAHADPNIASRDGTTPILAALTAIHRETGEHEAVALVLAERADDVDAALVAAVAAGYTPVAVRLLERGASIDAVDGYGQSVLAASATLPDATLYRLLVERGADVARFGAEALVNAAGRGSTAVVIDLLARGIDADSVGPGGATALLAAASGGEVEAVRLLLAAGADPAAVDDLDRGIEDYMSFRPQLLEGIIVTRGQSRAMRPTEHLEVELEDLTARHDRIRQLLAEHLASGA